jgi:hypothetical protein
MELIIIFNENIPHIVVTSMELWTLSTPLVVSLAPSLGTLCSVKDLDLIFYVCF